MIGCEPGERLRGDGGYPPDDCQRGILCNLPGAQGHFEGNGLNPELTSPEDVTLFIIWMRGFLCFG